YTLQNRKLYFGSEPKAILAHPDIRAEIDTEGLAEVFAISPARTPGHGVFKQINELRPGCFATFDRNGWRSGNYWQLESHPHSDDLETTAQRVYELLEHTVRSQLVSD